MRKIQSLVFALLVISSMSAFATIEKENNTGGDEILHLYNFDYVMTDCDFSKQIVSVGDFGYLCAKAAVKNRVKNN